MIISTHHKFVLNIIYIIIDILDLLLWSFLLIHQSFQQVPKLVPKPMSVSLQDLKLLSLI